MICQIKPTASLAAGKQKQKTHAHVRIQGTEGEGILPKKSLPGKVKSSVAVVLTLKLFLIMANKNFWTRNPFTGVLWWDIELTSLDSKKEKIPEKIILKK